MFEKNYYSKVTTKCQSVITFKIMYAIRKCKSGFVIII